MADHLEVDVDSTSHAVGNDAEELREELSRIAQEWSRSTLSHGWSGTAATAYKSIWEEWHEGAATLVDALAESSQRLGQAASAYEQQDTGSAEALGTAAIELEL